MKEQMQKLGYDPDSRLVIINSDDFGMCHSANVGTWDILTKGYGTAATIMVPCPWSPEALALAISRPDLSIGIELVLTSEWEPYRWGPVAPKEKVRSLIDEQGYFWGNNQLLGKHAKVEEAEIELRAQIDIALRAGLNPSHFINHMGSLYLSNRLDLKDLYSRLSAEFRLPSRGIFFSRLAGGVLYSMGKGKGNKMVEIVRALQPGIWELYPHGAVDSDEIRTITHSSKFVPDDKDSWIGRVSDTEIYTDLELKGELLQTGTRLVTWREIKDRLANFPDEEWKTFNRLPERVAG
jgi:chitin disaccharide deacetylase